MIAPGLALIFFLAGCGRPPVALKGPNRIQEARQIILRRVRSFRSETIAANVQVVGPGIDRACSCNIRASGLLDVHEVLNTGETTLVAIDNGSTAWTYTEGGAHYGVASQLAPSGFDLRWASGNLATLLSAASFTKVTTTPGGHWNVAFSGRVPGLGDVRGTLVYAPKSGLPKSLSFHVAGTAVTMAFSDYRVNPTFGAGVFSFSAPSGTTPVLADGSGISDLNGLQQSLHFPLAVPLARSGLSLITASQVASSTYGPEVLLEFNGNGGPLLLTEYADRFGLPQPRPSAYPITIGGLSVSMSVDSTSGMMATTEDAGTAVIAEGGDGEINAALQNLVLPPKG